MKQCLFFILLCFNLFAQNEKNLVFPETDYLYREDQFYVAGKFHVIGDRPTGIDQTGFLSGIVFLKS